MTLAVLGRRRILVGRSLGVEGAEDGGRHGVGVFIGKDVVHVRVMVLARCGVFDDGEEGFKVWWHTWDGRRWLWVVGPLRDCRVLAR